MDWVKEMTARWVRILSAAGEGGTPLDEAVHQISAISGMSGKTGWWRKLTQGTDASAEASAVTVLSRQLVAGTLMRDLMLDRLCVQAGQTREQVLGELTFAMPR